MKPRSLSVGLLACALFALAPSSASAALITFTHTGVSGSGTLAGNPFTNQPFTFLATGDTLNRQSFVGGFWIDHTTASVTIGGLGTFTFTTPTRTFFNDTGDIVGFSRAGLGGADLYNGPVSATLNGWDMLTSIGPVSGSINLLQWTSGAVNTSGGQLIFNNGTTNGTFRAVVGAAIPEPASLALFGAAVTAGYVGWRRRKPAAA